MNAHTKWQLTELVKYIVICTIVLVAMYALGVDLGDCPRC